MYMYVCICMYVCMYTYRISVQRMKATWRAEFVVFVG
jgi:hypothetical protein